MAEKLTPRETFTVDEGVLANMWVMEAIVELLERKGLCTKQEVHDMVAELRKRHGELNGKVIVPGPPPNTKEEQFLVDHVLKLVDAVNLKPAVTMSNLPQNKPSSAFPESYLSTEVSDRVIQQILDAFNRDGLTSEQSRQVLDRVKQLLALGELLARKTSTDPIRFARYQGLWTPLRPSTSYPFKK